MGPRGRRRLRVGQTGTWLCPVPQDGVRDNGREYRRYAMHGRSNREQGQSERRVRRLARKAFRESRFVQAPKGMCNPIVLLDYPARNFSIVGDNLQEITELRIFMSENHDALVMEVTSACVAFVPYRSAISSSRSRLKVPRAKAWESDAERSTREAPA